MFQSLLLKSLACLIAFAAGIAATAATLSDNLLVVAAGASFLFGCIWAVNSRIFS